MSSMLNLTPVDPAANVEVIKKNWLWFVVLGVGLVFLGVIGLGMSLALSFTFSILFGLLLLLGGGIHVGHAFSTRAWSGFLLELVVGALYIFGGLAVLAQPVTGVIVLTILLGLTLILHGTGRVLIALQMRRFAHWFWPLVGGVIAIFLGILIVCQIPLRLIGLLVAFELIFNGASFAMIGFMAKSLPAKESESPGQS